MNITRSGVATAFVHVMEYREHIQRHRWQSMDTHDIYWVEWAEYYRVPHGEIHLYCQKRFYFRRVPYENV